MSCGALKRLFPNLDETALNTANLDHLRAALTKAASLNGLLSERFAILNFLWPIAQHLKAPKDCTELAELLKNTYDLLSNAFSLNAKELLALLQACDALRRPERFTELLNAFEWVKDTLLDSQTMSERMRSSKTESLDTQTKAMGPKEYLSQMLQSALSIDHREVALQAIKSGLVAAQIGEAIDTARHAALEHALLIGR